MLVGGDDGIVELFDFSVREQQQRLAARLAEDDSATPSSQPGDVLAARGEQLLTRGLPESALALLNRARAVGSRLVTTTHLLQAQLASGDRSGALTEASENPDDGESAYRSRVFRLLSATPKESSEEAIKEAHCPQCNQPLPQADQQNRVCSKCGVNIDKVVAARVLTVMEPLLKSEGVAYTLQSDSSNDKTKPEVPTAERPAPPERSGMPGRPLIYAFEHIALRDAAFYNDPELMSQLLNPPKFMPLLHFCSKARLICEHRGWLDLETEEDEDEAVSFLDEIEIHSVRRKEFTVYVITMPEPRFSGEAHMVAIVHRDSERHDYGRPSPSTRYFTLEKTFAGTTPLLCEWFPDATRKNFSTGPHATVDEFNDAVFGELGK
jgi:hypothetical protein